MLYRCWFQRDDLSEFVRTIEDPDFDMLRASGSFLYAEENPTPSPGHVMIVSQTRVSKYDLHWPRHARDRLLTTYTCGHMVYDDPDECYICKAPVDRGDYPPDNPDTILPAGLEDTSIDQIW